MTMTVEHLRVMPAKYAAPGSNYLFPSNPMNTPLTAQQYSARKDASINLMAYEKSYIESRTTETPEELDDLAWRQYQLHVKRLDSLTQ